MKDILLDTIYIFFHHLYCIFLNIRDELNKLLVITLVENKRCKEKVDYVLLVLIKKCKFLFSRVERAVTLLGMLHEIIFSKYNEYHFLWSVSSVSLIF